MSDELRELLRRRLEKLAELERVRLAELRERVRELREEISREGPLSRRLRSVLLALELRLGVATQSSLADLEAEITRALESLGGVASVRELTAALSVTGWSGLRESDILAVIGRMASRGLVRVQRGVVFVRPPEDTDVARKVLDLVRRGEARTVERIASLLRRDERVVKLVVEALIKCGLLLQSDDGSLRTSSS